MAYDYVNPNYQYYSASNHTYDNQPYYNEHGSDFYNYSSSYYQEYEYGRGAGFSNEPNVRYDEYCYDTEFHNNPYQHFPTQSLIFYHQSPAANHNPAFSAKSSNFLDPSFTNGHVISYSNTQPITVDLDFGDFKLDPYHGGYDMSKTYGKPLPASEEICYPPSKIDPTPPPSSPFGKATHNPETQMKEDHALEPDESGGENDDDYDDDDDDGEEEEEKGILISPALPWKDDKTIDKGGSKPVNEALERDQVSESEEEEDEDEDEKEEKMDTLDNGKIAEKEIRRQIPGVYGLEAYDLCEGVFGGYFPCLRKTNQNQEIDYQRRSNETQEDAYGDCWNFTVDYLFGDPDPYARAQPDPIYGYQRYQPQQPLWEQGEYGGTHSISIWDSQSYDSYSNGVY